MISKGLCFLPVRSISLSCLRLKVDQLGGGVKKLNLNLKDEVKVPVETDTNKLATQVCGTNLFNEGEDVKLKPDSEYPDWLWTMRAPPPMEELDKNTKAYWDRVRIQREKEIEYVNSLLRSKRARK